MSRLRAVVCPGVPSSEPRGTNENDVRLERHRCAEASDINSDRQPWNKLDRARATGRWVRTKVTKEPFSQRV